MTNEERLEYCKVCLNRKATIKKGMFCNLTNDYPSFTDKCESYDLDFDELEKQRKLEFEKQNQINLSAIVNFKNRKEVGKTIIFISLVLLIPNISSLQEIKFSYLPLGSLIYGIFELLNGIRKENEFKKLHIETKTNS